VHRRAKEISMTRCIAAARSRTGSATWLAALAIAAAFCLPSATHAAETPGSTAPPSNQPSPDSGPSGNLSERLNQSGGVIKPPENVDPGLQKKPPEDSAKMPVIPPPGSPGGDPNVTPK
jgi:hypothetical protein